MTRTSRATFPRAVLKDRSESRTGLDKSVRKNGAGGHNWGSVRDEHELEDAALEDEGLELEEASTQNSDANADATETMTFEEYEKARTYRKKALKSGDVIDLGAIARSSAAVSTSPPSDSGSSA
ncbi:hypothetical protein BDN72DRAFT_954740 [Pluteus cervinus]|uniref:Uncharacterized protein n=1 Tax=Pluteus cervinus TaxID=181527 RepID=A0ACD3BD60_9AGAR|nr:hypothetical protein BDN72DRAFT_954740 [Pluteus cervinus]